MLIVIGRPSLGSQRFQRLRVALRRQNRSRAGRMAGAGSRDDQLSPPAGRERRLFCEVDLGRPKYWQCYCGKYKNVRYTKASSVTTCGVEITRSSVRRGAWHIELAAAGGARVVYRRVPSYLGCC